MDGYRQGLFEKAAFDLQTYYKFEEAMLIAQLKFVVREVKGRLIHFDVI